MYVYTYDVQRPSTERKCRYTERIKSVEVDNGPNAIVEVDQEDGNENDGSLRRRCTKGFTTTMRQ